MFIFFLLSLTIAADTYAIDILDGYFMVYAVGKCYATDLTDTAKKYQKGLRIRLLNINCTMLQHVRASCTDDTKASPEYYFTSFGCINIDNNHFIPNFDGKNVYNTYYTDEKCTTLDADPYTTHPVGTCFDSDKTKIIYTANNLYKRDLEDRFEIYIEGKCYMDFINSDGHKYDMVKSDGLMYQDDSCQLVHDSTVAATGDGFKVTKVSTLPEYYYMDRFFGKLDCNDKANFDEPLSVDWYHTKLATCNSK
ncbi:hypothetical protein EIN_012630 [Entamoeba invadens IP1]|uniref:Uncharacterized protein n=1 Tax=Entamoeba invadens IP1 TaxID=370355 RepID=L7FKM5_ENTIV|nr:hypothetical protein EIN_012630 [Entamoeba invadens IP1]ELP85736.1 hypothetical protein EIN_012630 [Entamoeba invadens IP1]|eukprot:XP_004185082.1 hypothetical protein EIN_012630 [Entamoeba invadens IP1]